MESNIKFDGWMFFFNQFNCRGPCTHWMTEGIPDKTSVTQSNNCWKISLFCQSIHESAVKYLHQLNFSHVVENEMQMFWHWTVVYRNPTVSQAHLHSQLYSTIQFFCPYYMSLMTFFNPLVPWDSYFLSKHHRFWVKCLCAAVVILSHTPGREQLWPFKSKAHLCL